MFLERCLDIRMTVIAVFEDRASLVGASKLKLCISNCLGAALGARLNRLRHSVNVVNRAM